MQLVDALRRAAPHMSGPYSLESYICVTVEKVLMKHGIPDTERNLVLREFRTYHGLAVKYFGAADYSSFTAAKELPWWPIGDKRRIKFLYWLIKKLEK